MLGKRKIEDAMRDINALNLSQPYDGRLLTPNEEMTGRQSLVNWIPATEEKMNSKITDYSPPRMEKGELKKTNPDFAPAVEEPQANTLSISEDRDTATKEENELSKTWVEKIKDTNPVAKISCGDRVFFLDHQVKKGPRKWRPGIIIQRKKEYKYATGIREARGFDIYDGQTCTYITRTRHDIRKYRPTKMEKQIMERLSEFLGDIRREFFKDERFIGPEVIAPPEFDLTGYDDDITTDAPQRQADNIESAPEPTS